MTELEKLICPCCGGTIDRLSMKCEYCGTAFRWQGDSPVIKVETFRNPVRTIQETQVIPREFIKNMGTEKVVQIAAQRLAQSLVDCIDFDAIYDPVDMSYKVYSTVKVVEPVNKYNSLDFWIGKG